MPRIVQIFSDEELTDLVSPSKLSLPPKPKIVDIKVASYQDWTGEDSLDVYFILGDDTTDDDLNMDNIGPIEDAVRDVIRDAGEMRFVYPDFGTRQDYEERFTYDPESDD